eukprot:1970753-Heterocapsa_arctica.AAC.1
MKTRPSRARRDAAQEREAVREVRHNGGCARVGYRVCEDLKRRDCHAARRGGWGTIGVLHV